MRLIYGECFDFSFVNFSYLLSPAGVISPERTVLVFIFCKNRIRLVIAAGTLHVKCIRIISLEKRKYSEILIPYSDETVFANYIIQ